MTALQSESIAKLMPALLAAEAEFTPAVKQATNPAFRSKYADLGSVLDAVRPALLKHGIVVLQPTRLDADGHTVLVTRLVHQSGEWVGGEYRLNPVQNTPQAEGSALTYARRYSVLSLCGIAPEDDDGEAASAPGRQQQRRQQSAARPYDNPAPLHQRIDVAVSTAELNDAAEAIGAAWLPDEEVDRLRQHYRERVAELRGEAA